MLDSSGLPILLPLATHLPSCFDGAGLHRAALQSMSRRQWATAERLFERAARRYRAELRVEPLARLRVHQLIARVQAGAIDEAARPAAILEVERRLCRLDLIESPSAPHHLTHARDLLASWLPEEDAARVAA